MRTLVWFRNDLRIADNPALHEAAARGPVIACFLVAREQWRDHGVSEIRVSLLERTLEHLRRDLAQLNIPLLIRDAPRFADAPASLLALAATVRAEQVAFNIEYPVNEQRRDQAATDALRGAGIQVTRYHAEVIQAPGTVLTQSGKPFAVFSAFKRRWLSLSAPAALQPLPAPEVQARIDLAADALAFADVDRQAGASLWPAGEQEALDRLQRFIIDRAQSYAGQRDFPGVDGTSKLSPYLSVGSLSIRQCLHAAVEANRQRLQGGNAGFDSWITELIWREFYRHVVALFPHIAKGCAFKRDMDQLTWRNAPDDFDAWREGRTGYPLVDAAMRQLKTIGWMHNRLRMVTAMFLTKHLLIDWRRGERYFMEQLVDGDFASNNGGWQWSASTGTDAVPYFRIFNPTAQGRKLDADGAFTRSMLPALATVPGNVLFEPWRYTGPSDYPEPIVEHRFARQRALDFFKRK